MLIITILGLLKWLQILKINPIPAKNNMIINCIMFFKPFWKEEEKIKPILKLFKEWKLLWNNLMDFKLKSKINKGFTVHKLVEILENNLAVGAIHLKTKEPSSLILQVINMLEIRLKMTKYQKVLLSMTIYKQI